MTATDKILPFKAALCILIVNLAACAAGISRHELLQLMQERQSPLIIDVRSQSEYDCDHIPGAVHISFTSVGSSLFRMGQPKTERVILYCEHGPRPGIAGLSLFLSGYKKLFSLQGHMKAWREEGLPIEIKTPVRMHDEQ